MTFRCGGIITENTRTIFRYERNNTSGGNTTESSLMGVESETNSDDQFNFTDNSSDSQILQQHKVFKELLTSQMSSMTRIVNGADCPPGECPWQVKTNDQHQFGDWLFLNADIWMSFIVQRSLLLLCGHPTLTLTLTRYHLFTHYCVHRVNFYPVDHDRLYVLHPSHLVHNCFWSHLVLTGPPPE